MLLFEITGGESGSSETLKKYELKAQFGLTREPPTASEPSTNSPFIAPSLSMAVPSSGLGLKGPLNGRQVVLRG